MENLDLTSPRLESKLEKGAFCPLRGFIFEFKGCGGGGGMGGLLLHFILSKIVVLLSWHLLT